MELTVHAPSCLDGQDRHLLVQSAAHRLVVHLRLLRDSVLKCPAGARVGAVPHRYVVAKEADGVPEGGVAVHSLGSVPACGHVGEDDVRDGFLNVYHRAGFGDARPHNYLPAKIIT